MTVDNLADCCWECLCCRILHLYGPPRLPPQPPRISLCPELQIGQAMAQRKQPELMIRRTKRHIFSCVKPVAKRLISANSIKFFTTRFLVTSLCGPIANPALPSHQRQPANSLPSHQ